MTTFKTHGGFFLKADLGQGGLIVADKREAGPWEEFEVVSLGGDLYAIKSVANGLYVAAEEGGGAHLIANRAEIGPWETFQIDSDGQTLTIRDSKGFYVCAEQGGGGEVNANRRKAGPWETFEADLVPGGEAAYDGRLRVAGAFLQSDGGIFRPVFVSGFTLATLIQRDRRAANEFLAWAAASGFNGVRVMLGELPWADQSPEQAREGLADVLSTAKVLGLYVEATALTGTAQRHYDKRAHVEAIAQLCGEAGNAIGEVANEPYHGTQDADVHSFDWLKRVGADTFGSEGVAWSCGAPQTDEPGWMVPGDWISLHLDRSRDRWNMVRRVREMEMVQRKNNKFVMNNEPIGWGEVDDGSRRLADPNIAYAMGVLSRGFEVGVVSHAEHGLKAQMPGPRQHDCHAALIEGFRALPTDVALRYRNVGWNHHDAPVEEADFSNVIRVYSFMTDENHGYTVFVGLKGDPRPRYKEGFSERGVVGSSRSGQVRIVEVAR